MLQKYGGIMINSGMRVILKEDVKLMSEQMPTGVSPAMKTGQHPDNDDIT